MHLDAYKATPQTARQRPNIIRHTIQAKAPTPNLTPHCGTTTIPHVKTNARTYKLTSDKASKYRVGWLA